MNDYTKDTREKNIIVLLSVIADLVLKKRSLCRLVCVIKAEKLVLCVHRRCGWAIYLR